MSLVEASTDLHLSNGCSSQFRFTAHFTVSVKECIRWTNYQKHFKFPQKAPNKYPRQAPLPYAWNWINLLQKFPKSCKVLCQNSRVALTFLQQKNKNWKLRKFPETLAVNSDFSKFSAILNELKTVWKL